MPFWLVPGVAHWCVGCLVTDWTINHWKNGSTASGERSQSLLYSLTLSLPLVAVNLFVEAVTAHLSSMERSLVLRLGLSFIHMKLCGYTASHVFGIRHMGSHQTFIGAVWLHNNLLLLCQLGTDSHSCLETGPNGHVDSHLWPAGGDVASLCLDVGHVVKWAKPAILSWFQWHSLPGEVRPLEWCLGKQRKKKWSSWNFKHRQMGFVIWCMQTCTWGLSQEMTKAVSMNMRHPPTLPEFHGNQLTKNSVAFEGWRNRVLQAGQARYTEDQVMAAISHSCREDALRHPDQGAIAKDSFHHMVHKRVTVKYFDIICNNWQTFVLLSETDCQIPKAWSSFLHSNSWSDHFETQHSYERTYASYFCCPVKHICVGFPRWWEVLVNHSSVHWTLQVASGKATLVSIKLPLYKWFLVIKQPIWNLFFGQDRN